MHYTASAPGKAILFGEHAVVYGKPAIAVAVNKYAQVSLEERNDTEIRVEMVDIGFSGSLNLDDQKINGQNSHRETGILKYVLSALKKMQKETGTSSNTGLNITIDLEMPMGSGLGSSAAVTVATLAVLSKYFKLEMGREKIAELAHQVEREVQGQASPIDTTLSTYGGAIYLAADAKKIEKLPLNWEIPLVIGHTPRIGNTADLIKLVSKKREKYPQIIDPLLKSMEQVTVEARKILIEKDEDKLGELMNINHGLLDALGVNTPRVSRMVYLARDKGARGAKITGAGGGGSIIAYCPGKTDEVLNALEKVEKAFPVHITNDGVT